jgi:hypothetical protein
LLKKSRPERGDARDASLRVSKRVRDSLKVAAAVMGRPLCDVTAEAMEKYLAGLKKSALLRRTRARKNS